MSEIIISKLWPYIGGALAFVAAGVFAYFKGRASGKRAGEAVVAGELQKRDVAWRNTRLEPKADPELERLSTVDRPTKADLDALEQKVRDL